MTASFDSLLEGVLARGTLKLEAKPKAPSRVPAATTPPKKRAMSPRSRVWEMDRQAIEEDASGPSTLKTSQSLEKNREREKTAIVCNRAKGGADLRSKIDYRCVDEYPVRVRGTMFSGLVRIPTDPTVDPPDFSAIIAEGLEWTFGSVLDVVHVKDGWPMLAGERVRSPTPITRLTTQSRKPPSDSK